MARRRPAVICAVIAAACLLLGLPTAAHSRAADDPWMDASQPAAQRARELVAAMTLDEKVAFLHGVPRAQAPVPAVGYLPPIPRLHVPGITLSDGPAGLRNTEPATELPAPIAAAASWNTTTAKLYGSTIGAEFRARGIDQAFGPGMGIDRVPLNGRNFEYFSEDPLLSGTISGADVNGIQSQGVVATIKHYVANNQETDRRVESSNVDDRTLHEIYEKNFGIAVQTGHPGSVMCSYNKVNGVYACGNGNTLSDLRQEFGFDGYVVSDYPATHDVRDIANGLNVELPTGINITPALVSKALADGAITMADIDQRLIETFTVLFRFGFFDHPAYYDHVTPIDVASGNAAARQVETDSAVLLKNDGVLPLANDTQRIAVIGSAAKTSAQGGGSSKVVPISMDDAYDAIVARAGNSATVSYDPGTNPTDAAAAAKNADVAVVFVQDSSRENVDRTTLSLSGNQDAVVSAVAAANPNTVVVMETGAPALTPWLGQVGGVLEAWYPGAQGGAAIASLLYGDADPSGKLPQTWPISDSQVPASTPEQFPGVNKVSTYSEGVDVGYRWYDAHNQTPEFPFGYGLSYTSFAFSHLALSSSDGTASDPVHLSVDVTNTGTRTGAQVVQAYVSKPDKLAATPPRELAAFAKVDLAPGQTRRVALTIDPRDLSYWDTDANAFTVQDGTYRIAVGDSSRSLPVQADYRVTKSTGPVRFAVTPRSAVVQPGSTLSLPTSAHNLSDFPVTDPQTSATVPDGWSVTGTQSAPAAIIPGATAGQAVRISVPASAKPGSYTVAVTLTGRVQDVPVKITHEVAVSVPYPSLAAAYDTVGTTNDSDTGPGNFDPAGYSFSATALANKGIKPGQPVTVSGQSVTWPAEDPGTPNALHGRGQVITVNASGSHLVAAGSATYNEHAGAFTVTYTDGTTAEIPIDWDNWTANNALPGASKVVSVHWNTPTGTAAKQVSVYGLSGALDPSKTVATVQLPTDPDLGFFVVAVR